MYPWVVAAETMVRKRDRSIPVVIGIGCGDDCRIQAQFTGIDPGDACAADAKRLQASITVGNNRVVRI